MYFLTSGLQICAGITIPNDTSAVVWHVVPIMVNDSDDDDHNDEDDSNDDDDDDDDNNDHNETTDEDADQVHEIQSGTVNPLTIDQLMNFSCNEPIGVIQGNQDTMKKFPSRILNVGMKSMQRV